MSSEVTAGGRGSNFSGRQAISRPAQLIALWPGRAGLAFSQDTIL